MRDAQQGSSRDSGPDLTRRAVITAAGIAGLSASPGMSRADETRAKNKVITITVNVDASTESIKIKPLGTTFAEKARTVDSDSNMTAITVTGTQTTINTPMGDSTGDGDVDSD